MYRSWFMHHGRKFYFCDSRHMFCFYFYFYFYFCFYFCVCFCLCDVSVSISVSVWVFMLSVTVFTCSNQMIPTIGSRTRMWIGRRTIWEHTYHIIWHHMSRQYQHRYDTHVIADMMSYHRLVIMAWCVTNSIVCSVDVAYIPVDDMNKIEPESRDVHWTQ